MEVLGHSQQLLGGPIDMYAVGLAMFELAGDIVEGTQGLQGADLLAWKAHVVRTICSLHWQHRGSAFVRLAC